MEAKLRLTLTPNQTAYTDPSGYNSTFKVELLEYTPDDLYSPGNIAFYSFNWEFTGGYYEAGGKQYPTFFGPVGFSKTMSIAGDSVTTDPNKFTDHIILYYKSTAVATLGYFFDEFPTNDLFFYRLTYNYNGLHTTTLEGTTGGTPRVVEITVNDKPGGVGRLDVSGDAGIDEVYYNGNTYYPTETTVSIPLVSDAIALGIQSKSPTATISANETVQKVQVGSKVYTSFPATVKGSPGETMGINVTAAPYPEITVKYEGTQPPVVTNT